MSVSGWILCAVSMLSLEAEPAALTSSTKSPVPSAEAQETIAKQLDGFYKLTAKRADADQRKLAEELLTLSKKGTAKPDERFVLLRKAMELASSAGDLPLMLQAIDEIDADFAIDALRVKEKTVAKFAETATDDEVIKCFVEFVGKLVGEAIQADRYDVALSLAESRCRVCQRSPGKPFRKEVAQRRDEVKRLEQEWPQLQQAVAALGANPDDPQNNLTVGRWYCFRKSQWEKGLPHLAKGKAPALKALASRELSPPVDAAGRIALGDTWWDYTGTTEVDIRNAAKLRAGYWYEQAGEKFDSAIVEMRVKKRLEELSEPTASTPPRPEAASRPAARSGRQASPLSRGHGKSPPLATAPFDTAQARAHQEAWGKYLGLPVEMTNSIGSKLALIPPGEFWMGSSQEEQAWASAPDNRGKGGDAEAIYVSSEGPRHRVRITRPFYLGQYEVTQGEYQQVMATNPSWYSPDGKGKGAMKMTGTDTSRYPVEMISWNNAAEFCRRLSQLPAEFAARRAYRLPTEAEWEYACRAGTTGRWFSGDDESSLQDFGWYLTGKTTHPVGQKRPNSFGLYDMHGNTSEWCADWFRTDYYQQSPSDDPIGPPGSIGHVMRGGSIYTKASGCRSARRTQFAPAESHSETGFRIMFGVR